jgi:hypothetical protein
MAWAHAFGGAGSCHEDPSRPMAVNLEADADCHGVHGASQPAPASHPCCDGGSCSCAVHALSVAPVVQAMRASRVEFIAAQDTSPLPARLLDDTLRPPIR